MDLDDGIFLICVMVMSSWMYVYLIGYLLLPIGLILTIFMGVLTLSYGVVYIKKMYSKVEELTDFEILYCTGCTACLLVFGGIVCFCALYVLIT